MRYTKRTHNCGALRHTDIGNTIVLNGWIHRIRDHGGIYFIDLRDRYGRTQIVIDQDTPSTIQQQAHTLHIEYCLSITGIVRARPQDTINSNMKTGEIEVQVHHMEILSHANTLPFMVEDTDTAANEDLRLKHRYLDLRSGTMQDHIHLRHKVMQSTRTYLNAQDFLEIETPTLIRSTPEGARDFLVPSRIKEGTFYALPQSPQLYKQILMMSGMDKYYQFARCYRDEDARGDRQPEHTQIDIELSFIEPEDIYALIEGLFTHIFSQCLNITIKTPFPCMSYDNAMNTYGTDKPDLRFDLCIEDFSDTAPSMDFVVFNNALSIQSEGGQSQQGAVKMLRIPNAQSISRKHIESLEQTAKKYGAKGLAWAKYHSAQGFSGAIGKFLTNAQDIVHKHHHIADNDLLLFVADTWHTSCTALGAVRIEVAKILDLIPQTQPPQEFSFAWITDFPLFEWNPETKSWSPAHHMFTMPQAQYLDSLEENPGAVKGELYDLVCNGIELASGSIRIHKPDIQQKIFNIIDMPEEEIQSRFGFLIEAMQYSPPPHGGIAPGLDRLLMIMTGSTTIRDVIAFPKNTLGASPLDDCPNTVSAQQLKDLHIKLNTSHPSPT